VVVGRLGLASASPPEMIDETTMRDGHHPGAEITFVSAEPG